MEDALRREIGRVNDITRSMIDEYVAWGGKKRIGEVQLATYDEILDFLNFRLESASSCLLLIENSRIADSLGLSRSLLEHYLLFILMCRGRKLFRIRDLSKLSEAEFKTELAAEQQRIQDLRAKDQTDCVEVRKAPRVSRRLMYVFDGLRSSDEPELIIPPHYFQFQEFRPEFMRLDDADYLTYFEPSPEMRKADREHRDATQLNYKFYLSYDGLLECLQLNDLIDDAVAARIEAHYTFLGRFLHPTHDATRDLHEHSNWHDGGTMVGMPYPYTQTAELLAAIYVCYLVAGLLDEAMGMIEGAPPKYISIAGTEDLRRIVNTVPSKLSYFWFLFNQPPLWDRFVYCIHHATGEDRSEWGSYIDVPLERVQFDKDIYGRLRKAVGGASNAMWGQYTSPLAHV